MESVIYLTLFLWLSFPILFFLAKKQSGSSRKLPPGSLGIPIIGQSFEFFRAARADKAEEWFQERSRKYGPIWILNIFGNPTVFVHGQAANKFIYTRTDKILGNKQFKTVSQLCGKRNLFELSNEDYKRIKGAITSFLKPDALKRSLGKVDEEIRIHLSNHWNNKHQISAMPLMKTLTFNVICSLIFGIERGAKRERLVQLIQVMLHGIFSVPINLPFTRFSRSLRARSKINAIVMELVHAKRENLKSGDIPYHHDLITSLLNLRDKETNLPVVTDEEILDNCIVLMLAGFDSSSSFLTILIKLLAENSDIRKNVLNEQEEIRKGKASNTEPLTWDDLQKMKYTWSVASETLRMNTLAISSTRNVLEDIEFEGYIIPKGWQVMWSGCMTHMDESIFADPLKFDPTRFDNNGTIPPYSFIPFGSGKRMCPGYEFARVQTLTMIHYLVTGFQWDLSSKENLRGRDPLPIFYNGLPIKVETREPAPK